MQFEVKDEKYLANLLGMDVNEFHRKVKKKILGDFTFELRKASIKNPDVGLNKKHEIFLVSHTEKSKYIFIEMNIFDYK